MADPTSRSGTNVYSSPDIIRWVEATHAPHDSALAAAFATPSMTGMPQIQVGPSEGKLLGLLVRLVGAKKVVELGTLAGYSALHLARAVSPGGKVWTVEVDPGYADVARGVLRRGGVTNVEVLLGHGVDVLPSLEAHGPFCAVFLDADKEHNDVYGRWAAKHTRPGGLLLADNAFLFGELLGNTPRAIAMRRFHEEAREAFDTVCIPTPDGLLLGVKR